MKATLENQSSSERRQKDLATETILVVDDHAELCEIAALLLRHCGYRVLTATHGEQAKKIARENADIHLLLTDVEMPAMRGDELAEWFRVTRPATAVVFMSGNPMQHRRLDSCYFVEKPFIHLDRLVQTVRDAVDSRRSTLQSTSAAA